MKYKTNNKFNIIIYSKLTEQKIWKSNKKLEKKVQFFNIFFN